MNDVARHTDVIVNQQACNNHYRNESVRGDDDKVSTRPDSSNNDNYRGIVQPWQGQAGSVTYLSHSFIFQFKS